MRGSSQPCTCLLETSVNSLRLLITVYFKLRRAGVTIRVGPHAAEQVQVLLHRSVAVFTLAAGLGERSAMLTHLFRRQALDIGFAHLDELDRIFIEPLVIVGGKKQLVAPVEAEPADVVHDG